MHLLHIYLYFCLIVVDTVYPIVGVRSLFTVMEGVDINHWSGGRPQEHLYGVLINYRLTL